MEKVFLQEEIVKITRELNYYADLYYNKDQSAITDLEFDQLLKKLELLENEHPEYVQPDSPTHRVGGKVTKSFDTITHKYPMLSLGNTYNKEDLIEFDQRVLKGLGTGDYEYFCELKFDGVAISLTYENGVLLRGVTRGDGVKGDDVTNNVKTIKSIPLRLQTNNILSFEVRGEVFMPKETFEELNKTREKNGEALLANPRNTTSGTLKMQDSSIVAVRKLDCFLYSLLGEVPEQTSHEASIELLEGLNFNISPTYRKCHTIEEVFEYIDEWEYKRKELPLETDGIVIKVNNKQQQEELGFTAKSPRWAISYKYKSEAAETKLKAVSYQVGRTGSITPVAELAPVLLAGTTVKRASLHNANEIERLDIRINDIVFVEKGGEIIPKITAVNFDKRHANSDKLAYISNCPECETPLIRKEGEANHYCPNVKTCPPQVSGRVEHFISRNAMDISNLGPSTIKGLLSKHLIQNLSDLYTLTFEQINGLEFELIDEETGESKTRSIREKSAQNIISSIEESKSKAFPQLLFGLGIRYVGKTVAEKLADSFGSIERIGEASIEEMNNVDEIGGRIAESVVDYFSMEENLKIISNLKNAGLQLEQSKKITVDRPQIFAGKQVVVSGVFDNFERDSLKAMIKEMGGKIGSGITSKTDYLLAGNNMGPAKLEKATKLNTTVLSETEFQIMISNA
ncbi:MAG: DNA ligase (NAD+) [Cyclobacteriaceae bacterium]|jgi:DNA ligase (NAD+)